MAAHLNYPISTDMRQRLLSFHIPNAFRANELMTVHTDFGEVLALAATAVMELGGVRSDEVSVIGVQAANLIHAIAGSPGEPSNGHLEIGELAVVAERTGCPVVGDLRPSDIALGGEGAPLSSFLDFVLFAAPRRSVPRDPEPWRYRQRDVPAPQLHRRRRDLV